MAIPQLLVLGSLGLGVLGTATATDLISLREIAHSLDLPLISGAIILARESMPSSVAHLLEPLAALGGLGALALPVFARILRNQRAAPVPARIALRLAAMATTL